MTKVDRVLNQSLALEVVVRGSAALRQLGGHKVAAGGGCGS